MKDCFQKLQKQSQDPEGVTSTLKPRLNIDYSVLSPEHSSRFCVDLSGRIEKLIEK